MVDWRCRESEGKAKIEGYMSVSDDEAVKTRSTKSWSEVKDTMICILK